jgi:hypothetical protein
MTHLEQLKEYDVAANIDGSRIRQSHRFLSGQLGELETLEKMEKKG